MNTIKIVGIGPGHKGYILPIAYEAVKKSHMVIGASRNLEAFAHLKKETVCYEGNLEKIVSIIKEERHKKNIAIIVSGDTGFYSLLDYIKKHLDEKWIEVIPGISSFQYLFARLKRNYKDYALHSLHGKSKDVNALLAKENKLFLLTDSINTPGKIASDVINLYGQYQMIVGENLSYPEERIVKGKVEDFTNKDFKNLCVVVIEKNDRS
ncbi:precorrin-6Y C5,15-methyltransferase (decarboxylating) [Natranaerovirga hydrolytica]|uniref:Precorrin-6Y C5,15-methyltransferase (Decarboxylating) n=1 Tax=Natranaerovirga hydrolytica TaxID=680378 RepID=A0A4R1MZ98_9FIRM|nr:precorrin-6y C5,15-methyltransferase (decarboxylating) subunit CbiE [Natranaerovirga hydrolytica]TCK98658.1 precorrin-6Y C5,15-methyltransferase (decarboxylating) [Natranaerovirga hydrolytica]